MLMRLQINILVKKRKEAEMRIADDRKKKDGK